MKLPIVKRGSRANPVPWKEISAFIRVIRAGDLL